MNFLEIKKCQCYMLVTCRNLSELMMYLFVHNGKFCQDGNVWGKIAGKAVPKALDNGFKIRVKPELSGAFLLALEFSDALGKSLARQGRAK